MLVNFVVVFWPSLTQPLQVNDSLLSQQFDRVG